MEKRRLGRLAHQSSVLIYGGAALADVDEATADRSLALALESGINHFDTSDDYGDSELHLGRWMPRMRQSIFLATKTTERSRTGAAGTIRRSLERLRADRVDLLQLHAIGDRELLDEVTGPGGALEAVVQARDEGLVGGIGITGHGTEVTPTHLEALRRFPFDTVLTPYSYRLCEEPGFREEFDALCEQVRDQDVGLMLIKYMARNQWRDGQEPRYTTWYEPFDDQRAIDAAVSFALARPEATGLCTAGDVTLLPKIVEAAKRARRLPAEEAAAVLSQEPDYGSPFVTTPGRTAPSWL